MEEEYNLSKKETDKIIEKLKSPQIDEFAALQELVNILKPLDKSIVKKLIRTLITFYDIEGLDVGNVFMRNTSANVSDTKFSDNRDISVKEFMLEKEPQTDVEKIACLAYYLTHYKNQEEFKTLDLSGLNTEAAQIKFANPAVAVDHATRHAHFLVATQKGLKKISAIGELYVQALPNRDEAKEVVAKSKPKRKSKKNKNSNKVANVNE